jgi:hypothetical protein
MAKVCDMETSQANHTAMKPPTPACAPPRWLSGSHAAWSAPLTGRYDDPYQHDGWIGWILRDHWIAFVSALGDGLLFDIAQETPRDGSSRLYNPQHFYRRDLAQEITAAEVSAYNAMCKAIERYTGTPLTPEQACDRARVYDLAAAAIDAKAEHESHAALNEAVQAYVGQFKDYVSRTTVNNLAAGIIKGAVADRKERAANAGASVVDAVRAAQKATEKLPPKRDPHEVEISISVGTDNAELGQYVRNRLAVYANDVMADYGAFKGTNKLDPMTHRARDTFNGDINGTRIRVRAEVLCDSKDLPDAVLSAIRDAVETELENLEAAAKAAEADDAPPDSCDPADLNKQRGADDMFTDPNDAARATVFAAVYLRKRVAQGSKSWLAKQEAADICEDLRDEGALVAAAALISKL